MFLSALLAASLLTAQGPSLEQRSAWWRDAKFGMFIHWGVYSVPADATTKDGKRSIAEWYFSNKQMPVAQYEKFAGQFNPVKFDAHKWVKIAKDAGMKYIVITSKHHDGFDMFDSKLSNYTIAKATPWKHDPMKDLAAECKKQGIRLCFYHSVMDWHHPDYLPRRPWDTRPAAGADFNRYIDYMKGQLKELLTNYGPIGIIWFDGGWEHNAEQTRSKEVVAMIRSLQPNILINDRIQLPEDYSTPEQTIPAGAMANGRLWETCMTMNDTWGYAKDDHNWKSAEDLIHKLCDIASKGGNFLLNVGPTAEGEFPQASIDRLAEIGKWMKINGESIRGTTKSPFKGRPWFDGRVTQKGNVLYYHVFKWPAEGLLSLGSFGNRNAPTKVEIIGQRKSHAIAASSTGINWWVPRPRHPDPYATVIKATFGKPPTVSDMMLAIATSRDGQYLLKASDAEIHGSTAQYEQGNGKDDIGYWIDAKDYVTWDVATDKAARYDVEIEYACEPGADGSTFTVGPKGNAVTGKVVSTGSWTTFRKETIGTLSLPDGRQTIEVKIKSMPHGAAMNLKSVRLIPVRGEK